MASSRNGQENEFSHWQEITPDLVKSAGRTMQILEYFADVGREASIHEVSKSLGYPHSSTSAILQTLTRMGYMVFNRETRAYKPCSSLALLGAWVDNRVAQRGPVLSLMEDLAERNRYMVVLGRRNGLYAKYVHVVQPADPSRHCPIGTMRPLVNSGAGPIILSGLTDAEIKRVALHSAADSVAFTPVGPAQLLAEVEQFRRTGFLFVPTAAAGISTLGIAVPDVDGALPMSLTISGPHDEISAETPRLLEYLQVELASRLGVYRTFELSSDLGCAA